MTTLTTVVMRRVNTLETTPTLLKRSSRVK